MGSWGTGISSNDTYADIYSEFIELYNDGLPVSKITEELIRDNQETITDTDDSNNFWFAIAKCQWECRSLDFEILEKVEKIIRSGNDLLIWKELGASPVDLKSREKALNLFLTKIQNEKSSPRKRTKKKLFNSVFKKGDCLVYPMDNGNFGGAFVLTDEESTRTGTNYIAITMIDKTDKPTLTDFKKADVYVQRITNIKLVNSQLIKEWIDRPFIGGVYADNISKYKNEIEVIGRLEIVNEYLIEDISGFGWLVVKGAIPFKDEYINLNGPAKKRVNLQLWTKKHWL